MITELLILARDNDNDVIKIVVGIVFLALWGLGALISAWNKKAEEERRRRQLGQLPKTLGADPYARQYPQYPAQAQYGYPVAQPPPPAAPQRSKKRRKSAISAPPIPTSTPEISAPAPMVAAQPQAPARPSAASEAARIGRLVHRHDSLRAALILQEVLSPPLSLR
jgi:hypothetical protein